MSSQLPSVRIIEPGRLGRAWLRVQLGGVEWLGEQQYRVIGHEGQPYYVDLWQDPACFCADSEYRGAKYYCYHTLAAMIVHQVEDVCIELGKMLEKKSA